ncbi:terminase small subunit [Pectobacterium odoriferum]|uniref:terminase small subunit n=1 Tax=Pectobacterium odoriferum TaxID=78398 RepID=UPI00052A440B|nr:terminase small subunit [Pectobacterium odoriferum]AIU88322.1 terminase small subunit [Pectobacterium odoriferum]POE20467.1 terminase small subunit [Pectobacterium odoriferum]POE37187.1 terminase small subunit [Pectobacterium odoriferum]
MKKTDWESIKRDYAAGQLSIRAIAELHGVSDTAIRKSAKKEGWTKPEKVRKTGSQKTTSANQNANPRTKQKNQIPQIENQIDSNCPSIEKSNDDWTLNPDEYGLNDMQARFVNAYLISMDKTAAYKKAGYSGEGNTAIAAACRLYRNVKVARAIRDALDARERRTQITQDDVLKMWWEIATADANQITELRRLCCRHCWGFGFQYQWQDAVEFEEASDRAKQANKPEPKDNGGYGFDAQLDPNPECPRCNGMGVSRSHFHDTRDLRGAARRLYAGVKEGKFGLEVITRNQDEALKMVAQHLGMLKNRTELTGADGGPINQVNYTPEDYAKAQAALENQLPDLD